MPSTTDNGEREDTTYSPLQRRNNVDDNNNSNAVNGWCSYARGGEKEKVLCLVTLCILTVLLLSSFGVLTAEEESKGLRELANVVSSLQFQAQTSSNATTRDDAKGA